MRFLHICVVLILCLTVSIIAQESEDSAGNDIDWMFEKDPGEDNSEDSTGNDIDWMFEEDPVEDSAEAGEAPSELPPEEGAPVQDLLQTSGFTFDVSYSFIVGYSPGWEETPWNWYEHRFETLEPDGSPRTEDSFTNFFAAEMHSNFSLDFRISPTLRVHQLFQLDFPNYDLQVREFFADYNMNDVVFFRAGKHTVNWGVSRNFPYTNLPEALPSEGNRVLINGSPKAPGDPYAIRIDVPIGIGGIQFLMASRQGMILDENSPQLKEFGFGLKYNLAFTWADIDIGTLYNPKMPYRSFTSLKSTLPFGTEIYGEGLMAVSPVTDPANNGAWLQRNVPNNWEEKKYSFNIGVYDEFFDRSFTANLEYFFNGERGAQWVRPETSFQEQEVTPFIYGHNGAVNLSFRPGLGAFRFMTKLLYNFEEDTAILFPAIQINPSSNLNIYFGVPMALGSREGTYYMQNEDKKNRPFSIVLAFSFEGNYRLSRYEFQ